MKPLEEIKKRIRHRCGEKKIKVHHLETGRNGFGAFFELNFCQITMIVSCGGGWDHVSVSTATGTPSWALMCWVKELCFEPEETAVQYHPPQSRYQNLHPCCLHLWRPQSQQVPLPPPGFV